MGLAPPETLADKVRRKQIEQRRKSAQTDATIAPASPLVGYGAAGSAAPDADEFVNGVLDAGEDDAVGAGALRSRRGSVSRGRKAPEGTSSLVGPEKVPELTGTGGRLALVATRVSAVRRASMAAAMGAAAEGGQLMAMVEAGKATRRSSMQGLGTREAVQAGIATAKEDPLSRGHAATREAREADLVRGTVLGSLADRRKARMEVGKAGAQEKKQVDAAQRTAQRDTHLFLDLKGLAPKDDMDETQTAAAVAVAAGGGGETASLMRGPASPTTNAARARLKMASALVVAANKHAGNPAPDAPDQGESEPVVRVRRASVSVPSTAKALLAQRRRRSVAT
jgi:hypothetical protein